MLAYVTVSMADAEGEEWFSLSVAHEYVSNLRILLTYDSQVGGYARFSISAGDLAMREESLDTKRPFALRITFWTRLSTIDSALTGTQLVATVLVSHASALPTRAAILEFNKKQLAPVTVAKAPSMVNNAAVNQEPTSTFTVPPMVGGLYRGVRNFSSWVFSSPSVQYSPRLGSTVEGEKKAS